MAFVIDAFIAQVIFFVAVTGVLAYLVFRKARDFENRAVDITPFIL